VQYERFRPENLRSESSRGDATPVVEVSWRDAKAYCAWLSEKSGRPMRLPSESEWECACRAGCDAEFTFGDDVEMFTVPRAVASKRPNPWGIFDLHGNVWEWCEDRWQASYDEAPADGSPWVEGGTPDRVYRGGVDDPDVQGRSVRRGWHHPRGRGWFIGFRPAFVLPEAR
jgi:formylglycine-generating enzyme required for sulfatase activity